MQNNINSNKISTNYSNCRVSGPILHPDKQDIVMNGFAWSSSLGMIHQVSPISDGSLQQWLGTQQ